MHISSQTGCFSGLFKRKDKSANVRLNNSNLKVVEEKSRRLKCDLEESETLPAYMPSSIPPEVVEVITSVIDSVDAELRILNLQIHDHPELGYHEEYAHDVLTKFMSKHGFKVTPHYLGLETAWHAEFSCGKGGRVIGVNSEMDALIGIGHACGHNLIAIAGCAIALAVKAALISTATAGKVVLLGTPAEESGGGKVVLLERGAYKEMNICIMCHPLSGTDEAVTISSSTAIERFDVEYTGHSAHAAAAPWEGTNALDAAFVAYSSISVLRQQMKPECRIHGIVQGKDWSPNVIPDNASMAWNVRAPTSKDAGELAGRAKACFQAGSIATGCKLEIKEGLPYFELVPNDILAKELGTVMATTFGVHTLFGHRQAASTDFGNVSYEVPSLHPGYFIPTEPNSGNHTPGFTKAARTQVAHDRTLKVSKGLALVAFRAAQDDGFFEEVKASFDEWQSSP